MLDVSGKLIAKAQNKMNAVKIKRANVVSYKRPSVQAIRATTYTKAGQVITVYPTIKGWFEMRRIDKEGVRYAEFIQRKDIRFTVEYVLNLIKKKIKSNLQNRLKKFRKQITNCQI